ncbi:MAG: hypothetical protein IJ736_15120 [Firmicutes bacterium]|nr:hypothetical protein [Bacillota bacterium]
MNRLIFLIAVTCVAAAVWFVAIAAEATEKTTDKEVYAMPDIPIYEMGDSETLGRWQKGEEFLIYDKNSGIVYYPNGSAYISENGYYVRYTQGVYVEVGS